MDELTVLPGLPAITDTDGDFIDDIPDKATEENVKDDQKVDELRGTRSTAGDSYDPSIHQYPPKETKAGHWRKKRKKAGDPPPQKTNASFRRQAQSTAEIYAAINHAILGPGAEPDKDELGMMIDAWEHYYQVYGVTEVSPKLEVAFASALYSYGVATREKVRPRVMRGLRWLGEMAGILEPEEENNASNDSGE